MPAKSLITRFLAIVMAVISANASTADVSIESTTPGQPTNIFINGALSWDQADQFIQKVEAVSTGTVFFNSKGGDLLAGLIIGQAIRRKKFATVVKRGGLCESVCGLAWLGGAQRFLEPPSRIGFRAAADDWERGNASLGAYLNELGLSAAAVNFITDALDRDANWLDQARAEKLGIAISLWPHSETAPPEPGIPAESLWSYNNSTLRLVIDGAQWKFYYEAPRPELAEMGIRRGTMFSVGQKRARRYRGIAMVFSPRCGATPYSVRGEISAEGQTILLRGKAPSLDGKCRVQSTWDAVAMLIRDVKAPSDAPVSSISSPP